MLEVNSLADRGPDCASTPARTLCATALALALGAGAMACSGTTTAAAATRPLAAARVRAPGTAGQTSRPALSCRDSVPAVSTQSSISRPGPPVPLRQRLRDAIPAALKAGDRVTVSALRSALTAIENAE